MDGNYMIKIAVCEDQREIGQEILEKLQSVSKGYVHKIDLFETAESLLYTLEKRKYDIYYLDIMLDGSNINGYELAKELRRRQNDAILIFLSCHEEYACEAYEVDALRFLRKPIEKKKFEEAFTKAVEIIYKRQETFYYMSEYMEKEIQMKEIRYFESQGRKIVMNTVNGKNELFYGSIKSIKKQLEQNFFCMCHTSFLVNIACIQKITGKFIVLDNGEELPISRTYTAEIRKKYANYLFMLDEESQ